MPRPKHLPPTGYRVPNNYKNHVAELNANFVSAGIHETRYTTCQVASSRRERNTFKKTFPSQLLPIASISLPDLRLTAVAKIAKDHDHVFPGPHPV